MNLSIDHARQAFLAFSLTRLAIQQHKIELEMAAIQQLRLQLATRRMHFQETAYARHAHKCALVVASLTSPKYPAPSQS